MDSSQTKATGTLPGDWFEPFKPRRVLANAHAQTLAGNYLPRPRLELPVEREVVEVDPTDGSRVRCDSSWQPETVRGERLTVVLVHGLEGSSESGYVRGIAGRAWAKGWNVVRMNMRNCGGTESLTPTLYNSAQSGDVGAVIDHCRLRGAQQVALVGYSMGGNLVLKLAGEWGARDPLLATAGVCPAIDLAAGSDALHEPVNRAYEWHFLRGLMARLHRKAALLPSIYDANVGPVRSLREFDDKVVARYCGYRDANDYYYRAAGARVVEGIARPTLIVRSLDDPFIRLTAETRDKLKANSNITLVETQHGGHCAFLSEERGESIHWAEALVIRWLAWVSGGRDGS
ncbi:MAG: alpha/beta fold hydrolase [Terracidiphilus sp.]|nr:alpha/beta fold hydrolase [Terracidiphilus sp.]